jgi:hypothetical protein
LVSAAIVVIATNQTKLIEFGAITATQALLRSLSARVRANSLAPALSRRLGARVSVYWRSNVILCVLELV